MSTVPHTVVVGVFLQRSDAQQAVDELRREGFAENQIGVVAREGRTLIEERSPIGQDSAAEEGAIAGTLAGASIGGLWAVGIAAGLLPAIGPVIAGGIFASLIASAAAGAIAGGILGSLIGLGIPEDEARFYEQEFQSGRTLVTVQADSRYDDAQAV
jgi:hypothetical protein